MHCLKSEILYVIEEVSVSCRYVPLLKLIMALTVRARTQRTIANYTHTHTHTHTHIYIYIYIYIYICNILYSPICQFSVCILSQNVNHFILYCKNRTRNSSVRYICCLVKISRFKFVIIKGFYCSFLSP